MTVIKAIGVLSVAKISGSIGALVGLVIAIPVALVVYFTGSTWQLGAAGWVALVALPLLYGAAGFVGGALYAWLYNVVSGWVGGIEVDLVAEARGARDGLPADGV